MRGQWRTEVLLAVAITCLGAGFVAGRTLGRGPEAVVGADLDPAVAAVRAETESATGAPTASAEEKRLAAAASAWSQVPQLQVAPKPLAAQPRKRLLELDQLPEPVRKVVDGLITGRVVQDLELEARERDGQPHFKVQFDIDGFEQEYRIDELGAILATDFDMAVADVPTAVSRGIEADRPGAILLDAERNQEGSAPPYYEINIDHDGVRMGVRVGEDGTILRRRVH